MKGTAEKLLRAALLSLSLVIAGCGGGGGDGVDVADRGQDNDNNDDNDTASECTVADEKQIVHDLMNDVYFWYDEVPDVDPADYENKQALLNVLIQPEKDRDHIYSYLTTKTEEDAFLNNAGYVGFGFSMTMEGGRVFLRESFPDGPAYAAGMRRGDEIVAIDGEQVSSMSTTQLNEALGPSEEGYEATFEVDHPERGTRSYTIAKTEVETPVVGTVQHDLGAGDTTYIFFRSFVNPAFDELSDAFAAMQAAGDTKLVLDLRYNGGGLVSVAEHLGSLIAGIDQEGEIIAELKFNDRYQSLNDPHYLEQLENSVDLTDIVVITTGGTASASEMIINGLRPFSDTINVATVGATSYGKPVGQSRLEFSELKAACEEDILRAVTFKVVNANDVGDYYTGIAPTCAAEDDLLDPLGDPSEASMQSALYYLENGACEPTATTKAMWAQAKRMSLQPDGDPLIRDGFDLLRGGAR